MRPIKIISSALAIVLLVTATSGAVPVPIAGIDVLRVPGIPATPPVPANRSDGSVPNAADGDLNTFSYLTNAFTRTPHIVAFDVGSLTDVNHLRVSKFSDVAGTGQPQDTVDLQILFTTDTGPLIDRTYMPVSGLTSGYLGGELIDAASVNSADATVVADNHDYIADSEFYSLSFDTTAMTALAIRFEKTDASSNPNTHYRVRETQLLEDAAAAAITDVQVFSTGTPEIPPLASNPRSDGSVPNAIDGDENTWTYMTNSNTDVPHIAALDLGSQHEVYRLRVKKFGDNDAAGPSSGTPGNAPIDNMDLQILYTTDTGPMSERTYQPVSGLTSGDGGAELINADGVNPADATVDNDHHDFDTDGWYSLTFDAVGATGIAVQFARDAGDTQPWTHYRVYEFQVEEVPEPQTWMLAIVGIGVIALVGRKRRVAVARAFA